METLIPSKKSTCPGVLNKVCKRSLEMENDVAITQMLEILLGDDWRWYHDNWGQSWNKTKLTVNNFHEWSNLHFTSAKYYVSYKIDWVKSFEYKICLKKYVQ